jgi:hypothetical protein
MSVGKAQCFSQRGTILWRIPFNDNDLRFQAVIFQLRHEYVQAGLLPGQLVRNIRVIPRKDYEADIRTVHRLLAVDAATAFSESTAGAVGRWRQPRHKSG